MSEPRPGFERAMQRAGRPGLEPLWDELARRYGASERPVTSVSLVHLDESQRVALADLLALDRLPTTPLRLQVGAVARSLGLPGGEELRAVVEAVRGPIIDRSAERRRLLTERAEMWSWFEASARELGLEEWAVAIRSAGVPGRDMAAHRIRLEAALSVLRRVLALDREREPMVLASLASDVLGDPHALDPGTPVGSLVVDALARSRGEAARRADEVRATWEEAGVATDDLSSSVIVSGLLPLGCDPVATHLRTMAVEHEPSTITLSQLRRWPLHVEAGAVVHVVENPSLMAEARRRGTEAGLVCTSGWPKVAVVTVLRQLVACGAVLRCHADFDSSGILILRHLMSAFAAEPWAMTADAYCSAVHRSSVPLSGFVVDTPWEPALATSMRRHGKAVFEEDVREELLGSLSV